MATRSSRDNRSLVSAVLLVLHGLFLVGCFVTIASPPIQARSRTLLGSASSETVRATAQVTFIDKLATSRKRLLAAERVAPVFSSTVRQAIESKARAATLFQNILHTFASIGTNAERRKAVQQLLVADSVPIEDLPRLSLYQWQTVENWSLHLLNSSIYEQRPFDNSSIPSMLRLIDGELPPLRTPTYAAITDIVRTFITPTHRIDYVATRRLRREAAARVPPVVVTLSPGTIIVRRGQVITPGIFQELQAVGLPAKATDWRQRISTVLFGVVVVILLLWYLRWLHPEVISNQLFMGLLDVTVLVSLLAGKVVVPHHNVIPYLLPVGGAAALASLLISSEVAVGLSVAVALLLGWIVGHPFDLTVYYLTTAISGAMAVQRIRRLKDFILAGVVIAFTCVLLITAFRILPAPAMSLGEVRNYVAAAGFNGLVSAALAFGGYILLGNTFGITTSLALLELGHPAQKLLRRLMSEAPGTYNHSLVVASMVERAAGDIEADALLARVMALYHDTGKVANPLCFIENQMGVPNIHDDLNPAESAEIIRAHVTHGLVLAKQHRLPAPIRDAIAQHHGTMLMSFFFHRALQDDPDTDAVKYRYPGPLPASKEAALLMLADGCEGAVRAAGRKSPQTIREIVDHMIDERLTSGQLNQSSLTLRDIAAARLAFVEVLNGIYHPRIEYPDPPQHLPSLPLGSSRRLPSHTDPL